MKVLLRFYNSTNLGDDLFIKIITSRYPDDKFTVPVYNRPTQPLNSNVSVVKYILPQKIYSILNRLTTIANSEIIPLALRADIMVYIGGSIFMQTKNKAWARERRFYKSLRKPYYILGSNIGPFWSSDFIDIIRGIIGNSADTCLRDKSSFKLVKDIPQARLATDIAFTLDSTPYSMKKNIRRAVISTIDSRKKFNTDTAVAYDTTVAEMTKRLVEEGYSVVYMSFCKYEGDEDANERILSMLDENTRSQVEIFNYRGNLDESLQLLASSELIIGSRFHANILGLVFGKKVLPMAYSDKTIDILKDMNFPGQVIDIREIESLDVDAIDFDAIPIVDVSAQKKLAETQFQELDKVLTKKS